MTRTHPFIPFHVPSIGDEETREVEATLRSGWLTTGPRTAQFEKEFSAYVRASHAIAEQLYKTSSGSAGPSASSGSGGSSGSQGSNVKEGEVVDAEYAETR